MSEPDLLVDGSGLSCVRLVLRLRADLHDLPARALVHVVATDPAAPLDLPAWCHLTGHEFLGRLPHVEPPRYALRVAERPTPTDPQRPWRAIG